LCITFAPATSQILIVSSRLALASSFPSGEKLTDMIDPP
jgi:hypothetical protein